MMIMVDAVGRRNKLDIMTDLLRLSKNGSKKTRLVYLANINFNMLKKYVTLLESKGFIYNSDDLIYTSREGFDFLRQYDELMIAWDLVDNDTKGLMPGVS
jgi:predicted transcriptional regulator